MCTCVPSFIHLSLYGGRHLAVGPELGDGLTDTQASTGGCHSVLIRSGGSAVLRGNDSRGKSILQCLRSTLQTPRIFSIECMYARMNVWAEHLCGVKTDDCDNVLVLNLYLFRTDDNLSS